MFGTQLALTQTSNLSVLAAVANVRVRFFLQSSPIASSSRLFSWEELAGMDNLKSKELTGLERTDGLISPARTSLADEHEQVVGCPLLAKRPQGLKQMKQRT